MKKFKHYLLAALLMGSLASCNKNDDTEQEPTTSQFDGKISGTLSGEAAGIAKVIASLDGLSPIEATVTDKKFSLELPSSPELVDIDFEKFRADKGINISDLTSTPETFKVGLVSFRDEGKSYDMYPMVQTSEASVSGGNLLTRKQGVYIYMDQDVNIKGNYSGDGTGIGLDYWVAFLTQVPITMTRNVKGTIDLQFKKGWNVLLAEASLTASITSTKPTPGVPLGSCTLNADINLRTSPVTNDMTWQDMESIPPKLAELIKMMKNQMGM